MVQRKRHEALGLGFNLNGSWHLLATRCPSFLLKSCISSVLPFIDNFNHPMEANRNVTFCSKNCIFNRYFALTFSPFIGQAVFFTFGQGPGEAVLSCAATFPGYGSPSNRPALSSMVHPFVQQGFYASSTCPCD